MPSQNRSGLLRNDVIKLQEPAVATEFQINRLSDVLGAEITGLDLSRELSDDAFARIHEAFLTYQVLCFRRQTLTPRDQIAFSRRFGSVVIHDNAQFALKGNEEILVLSNDLDADGNHIGVVDAGDTWHSDLQFKPNPAKCTILYSLRNPSTGGATDFTNQYLAYESLDPATRNRIASINGVNSISKLKNKRALISGERKNAAQFYRKQERANPDTEHPLARVHPETGRISLYCSPRFTYRLSGMTEEEGDTLLDKLIGHSIRSEHRYRHHWKDGDVVMWDNRCVNHRATGGYTFPDIRLIHRTTVMADDETAGNTA